MNNPNTQQIENEEEHFETFFQGWLTRQAEFLQQLFDIQTQLLSDHQGNVNDYVKQAKKLIARVMAHYNQYYEAKSRVAHRNIFLVISPPWLTPYERTFLWIAGFKPSMMFVIFSSSGVELTPDQACPMEMLVAEIATEEQQLAEQLSRAEQEFTAPSIFALASTAETESEVDEMALEAEMKLDRLMSIMETLVARADDLRKKTVLMVIEILNVSQTVRFLAGVAQLQLTVRLWGTQTSAPIGELLD